MREGVSVCFDWSRLIFNRSKLVNQVFQKGIIGLFQTYFSNSSFLFSLCVLALCSTIQFLSFSFKIFARFLSLEAGKSLLPFFFKFISWFHAFFMHYHGYFRHFQTYWGFWWFEPILVKLINGFLCYDAIMMFPIV